MEGHKLARSVFVGNLSYDATDDEIIEFLSQAGPVNAFRLVRDKDTGRSKGFGFCEFKNSEHAQYAIKNMRNMFFKGRTLRIGQSNKDYNPFDNNNDNNTSSNFNSNKNSIDTNHVNTQVPFHVNNNFQPQNILNPIPLDRINLPPTLPILNKQLQQAPKEIAPPPISIETKFPDNISALNAEQLYRLMLEIKNLINQNPNEARKLLTKDTKLLYTLLYAQLLMKNIDPQITIAMLNRTDDQIPQVEHESGLAPTNIKNPAYNDNDDMINTKKQMINTPKVKNLTPIQQPSHINTYSSQSILPINASSLPMPPNMPEFNAGSTSNSTGKHKSSRASKLPLPKIPKMEPMVPESNTFNKPAPLPLPTVKQSQRTSDLEFSRNSSYNNAAASSSATTVNTAETPSKEQIVELMQQLSQLTEEQIAAIPTGERDVVISLRKKYLNGLPK